MKFPRFPRKDKSENTFVICLLYGYTLQHYKYTKQNPNSQPPKDGIYPKKVEKLILFINFA